MIFILERIISKLEHGLDKKDNEYLIFLRDEAESSARKNYIVSLLVLGNQKIIKNILKRYKFHNEIEDFHQESLIALYNAAVNYTNDKPMSFEQYAGQCIKTRIQTYILKQTRLIAIPWFFIKKKKDGKISDFEKESLLSPPLSLHSAKCSDDDSILLRDTIQSDVNIEEEYLNKEKELLLKRTINKLDALEQKILMYRYGLYGHSPTTLRSISEKLGYDINRIYKIERNAIKKLKKIMTQEEE